MSRGGAFSYAEKKSTNIFQRISSIHADTSTTQKPPCLPHPSFIPLILSQTINFRIFQTKKKFADDNFEFDENGGKLSERIENTVGKKEIARYEQFLLFPQCFQETFSADT